MHFFAYPDLPGHPIPGDCTVHGVGLDELTSGAPRHDCLSLTGGAMYTISALWSYAREQCDVTTIASASWRWPTG